MTHISSITNNDVTGITYNSVSKTTSDPSLSLSSSCSCSCIIFMGFGSVPFRIASSTSDGVGEGKDPPPASSSESYNSASSSSSDNRGLWPVAGGREEGCASGMSAALRGDAACDEPLAGDLDLGLRERKLDSGWADQPTPD